MKGLSIMQFDTRGLKVLVADNDRTVLELLQIRLDVAGYHIIAARTGRAVLDILQHTRPAALVLDLNLPDMKGFDVLQALRASGCGTIPILVIGRRLATEDIQRAVSLGARDCMTKPFSGAEALERVARLLRRATPAPAPLTAFV
jgi:DNA-binding response OmpR family regulator